MSVDKYVNFVLLIICENMVCHSGLFTSARILNGEEMSHDLSPRSISFLAAYNWDIYNRCLIIIEKCLHYGKLYPIGEYVDVQPMIMDTCPPKFNEKCELTYDDCDFSPFLQNRMWFSVTKLLSNKSNETLNRIFHIFFFKK